jgi:alanyl-tRNA synthetase
MPSSARLMPHLDVWELLTQEFRLPVERLWITVHIGDDESARLWEEVGVDTKPISSGPLSSA